MAREYHARPGADNEIHQKMKDISLTIDAAEWFGCEAPIIAELESGEVEAANAALRRQSAADCFRCRVCDRARTVKQRKTGRRCTTRNWTRWSQLWRSYRVRLYWWPISSSMNWSASLSDSRRKIIKWFNGSICTGY
ncbi:DNA helicase [Salmonella phage SE40]|nr:DNA helicase [Salmonella phage SE40]